MSARNLTPAELALVNGPRPGSGGVHVIEENRILRAANIRLRSVCELIASLESSPLQRDFVAVQVQVAARAALREVNQ